MNAERKRTPRTETYCNYDIKYLAQNAIFQIEMTLKVGSRMWQNVEDESALGL